MTHSDVKTWGAGRAVVGIVLIFIGFVYAGVYLGIFDWTVWQNLWRLWPLILVGVGLSMLLPKRIVKFGTLFIIAIIALVSFWLLWRQSTFYSSGSIDSQEVALALEDGVTHSKLQIELPSASIKLSGPSDTDRVATGFIETKGIEHEFTATKNGDTEELLVRGSGPQTAFVGAKGRIELQLSGKLSHNFDFSVARSDVQLDLTSLLVDAIRVRGGSSTIDIVFGEKSESTTLDIASGASSISLSAPESVGVRMEFTAGLSSTTLDGLSSVSDDVYQSENFDESAHKILINIESGVSSVVFRYR